MGRWLMYVGLTAALVGSLYLGSITSQHQVSEGPDALHWCDEGLGCSDA